MAGTTATLGDTIVTRLRSERKRTLVMGIVNATPDSFFEGSRAVGVDQIVERARRLQAEGADILDLGGQSTRPGSEPVSVDEELRRVIPAVERIAQLGLPVSIDTDKPAVAAHAREAGATILNDIAGLRAPNMLAEAVRFDSVIMMHMAGTSPKDMQAHAVYQDVVSDIKTFFTQQTDRFVQAGGDKTRLVYDPGLGFGKDLDQNLALIRRVDEFSALGPVLLGVSRKSFLGKITPDSGPSERLEGSLAVAVYAALRGVAALRVHDVAATRKALAVIAALQGGD